MWARVRNAPQAIVTASFSRPAAARRPRRAGPKSPDIVRAREYRGALMSHASPVAGAARSIAALFVVALAASACTEKDKPQPSSLVPDAGPAAVAEAAAPVDPMQCQGCQLAPQPLWSFEGIYRDDACTDPLAQTVIAACAQVPALGQVTMTYTDEVGSRKAAEVATVKLVEVIAANVPRYRKSGKACVKVNDGGVDVTPVGCENQRVCRDATGAIACAGCRTFASGCADYEETRLYASIDDPVARGAKPAQGGGGGGGNVARLRQCCAALGAEAARLGNSPELASAAAQCMVIANAAGPSGNAPELGALRAMLAGRTIPPICAGF